MTALAEQIQAAYQRDQLNLERKAVSRSDIPLSYESITNEWLTEVLCSNTPGAVVQSHSLGPKDDGSSNRRKISLAYNRPGTDAGLPTALFAKASHDLPNRMILGLSGAAKVEVAYYRDVRPGLTIESPVGFHAALDEESFNSIILLEDISDRVIEFCSHRTVMTVERAQSQLRALAAVHGKYFGKAESPDGSLRDFDTWPEFFQRVLAFGMKAGSEAGFRDGEGIIPSSLFKRVDEIWPKTVASVAMHDRHPKTLAHGDVHLKNWYVSADGEMGLADWQCAHRGSWARDVAYTLSTSLTIEDRRNWERDLVALYVDELQAAGGPKVDLSDAFTQYSQQLITALTWWTITLHPAEGMPDMQPRDITEEFVRRISTAMDDLGTLDLL